MDPSEYRGLNTGFAISADVEIGCKVSREAQYNQMLGRSCRSRGVCNGRLYVNTGEDEPAYLNRIRVTDYNKMLDYIELLNHLSII